MPLSKYSSAVRCKHAQSVVYAKEIKHRYGQTGKNFSFQPSIVFYIMELLVNFYSCLS